MYPEHRAFTASQICALSGVERPDRLRSWHTRDGLDLGEGAKRRYTFQEGATLRVVNDLAACGLEIRVVARVVPAIAKALDTLALFDEAHLLQQDYFLIVGLSGDPDATSAKIVAGRRGEAGTAALNAQEGGGISIVFGLSRSIIRTQRAYRAGAHLAAGEEQS